MKGNFQARFLGEGAAVMPLPYPTFLSSEPCGRQLNRHTGYEASAAAKDGRASVQKPTDKTVVGSARHELPVGPLPDSLRS